MVKLCYILIDFDVVKFHAIALVFFRAFAKEHTMDISIIITLIRRFPLRFLE